MEPREHLYVLPVSNFRQLFQAFSLVHDQYCKCGYEETHPSGLRFTIRELLPTAVAFVAVFERVVVGTATGILHGPAGLPASNLFGEEIHALRGKNRTVLESTKFASTASSTALRNSDSGRSIVALELLRTLFNWGKVVGVDDWLVVVNPKHSQYYVEELGFDAIGDVRACPHVANHPGVLLRLDVNALVGQRCTPTSATKQLFLQTPASVAPFIGFYRLREEEVALLLLERLDVVQKANAGELSLLQHYYPGATRVVQELTKDFGDVELSPRSSAIKAFSYFLDLLPFDYFMRESVKCPLHVSRYLTRILLVLELYAQRKGVFLLFEVRIAKDQIVEADPVLVGQLLVDLIVDIVETSKSCVPVRVLISLTEAGLNGNTVEFEVTGEIKRLLYTTSRMVHFLGGTASFWKAGGGHSRIRLRLPVSGAQDSHERHADFTSAIASSGYGATCKSFRLLVVENNPIDAKILERLLSQLRCEVICVSSGEEALKLGPVDRFDVVLLDIVMPKVDGFSVLREIRAQDKVAGVHTPVIAVTALVLSASQKSFSSYGFDDVVEKPIFKKRLLQSVTFVFDGLSRNADGEGVYDSVNN